MNEQREEEKGREREEWLALVKQRAAERDLAIAERDAALACLAESDRELAESREARAILVDALRANAHHHGRVLTFDQGSIRGAAAFAAHLLTAVGTSDSCERCRLGGTR